MSVVRLDRFIRVPEKLWKEGRPRVVEMSVTHTQFEPILASPDLVAVVVLDTRQVLDGDPVYGEVSSRMVGNYELIYRDEITHALERRTAFDIDAVTARIALEKRLDLISTGEVYYNPSFIGQVFNHRSKAMIAPHFDDGAYADERIKLPTSYHLLMNHLRHDGYTFDGSRMTARPPKPPRRATPAEEYAARVAAAINPPELVEW